MRAEKSLKQDKAAQVAAFNEAIKPYKMTGMDIKVSTSVGVGEQYQTITDVTTLDNINDKVSIEHTPGTVMMIDFWATWCPPCQRPMQHNQDMLVEHKAKWGDKVVIVGLSIDRDAATVTNHINNKGWTAPVHYHRAGSNCSDVY
jgi:thiol-disulfide isomerase/thioredoxin